MRAKNCYHQQNIWTCSYLNFSFPPPSQKYRMPRLFAEKHSSVSRSSLLLGGCHIHNSIGDIPYVARASFFKEIGGLMAGSTQSKQWRIELLYRYKRAKTSKITVLNIRKSLSLLCLLQTVCHFERSSSISLNKVARTKREFLTKRAKQRLRIEVEKRGWQQMPFLLFLLAKFRLHFFHYLYRGYD